MSLARLDELKREMGSQVFASQYHQEPNLPDGDMIKAARLGCYDAPVERNRVTRVVLTCDRAGKAGPQNDYTAITVMGILGKEAHVLHVTRGHWTVMQLVDRMLELAEAW